MPERKVTPIPRFEPEVIEATAKRRYRGDTEKVATTSIRAVTERGVSITSRYNKADEYELMLTMVRSLSWPLRDQVKSIFCDSKASVFTVSLRIWNVDSARAIGRELEETVIACTGGHNGLFIAADFGDLEQCVEVQPNWRSDEG